MLKLLQKKELAGFYSLFVLSPVGMISYQSSSKEDIKEEGASPLKGMLHSG
jgi:hypothetical protein